MDTQQLLGAEVRQKIESCPSVGAFEPCAMRTHDTRLELEEILVGKQDKEGRTEDEHGVEDDAGRV